MYLKYVVAFVLLANATSWVYGLGNSAGNNYTWGTRGATDTLIASERVVQPRSLFSTVTRAYTLTQSGTARTITNIVVTDNKKIRGATAVITNGGVGSTTVTITFTSALGSSIKSTVEIYGA